MTTPDPPQIQGRAFSHPGPGKPNRRALPADGLYLITPDGLADPSVWALTGRLLASGAVRWLQYRDKAADPTLGGERADRLRRMTAEARVSFIINDDVALASRCGAEGVHLGKDDADPVEARRLLGDSAVVGVSCYDSLHCAEQAIGSGADYVAFGACYPSRSKSTTRRATPDLFRRAGELGWPTVAIGGLEVDNAGPIIGAGARWTAMIQGIYGVADPIASALRIQALYAQGK